MPTELLSPGRLKTLVQNVVYATPTRLCNIAYQGTAPEVSNDKTTWAALTASGLVVPEMWVRSTATDSIISFKAR